MKKLSILLIMILGVFTLVGCGKKEVHIEGKLDEIFDKIYEKVDEENLPMGLTEIEITKDNIEQFVGTKDIEFESASASESQVGSIAYSVVLIRTKKGADVEEIKKKIEDNINPRKWICVGVEKEDVIIDNKGDLVIAIVVEDEAARKEIHEGFNSLK